MSLGPATAGHGAGFAQLPDPPYYAVIFSSSRNGNDDDDGYQHTALRMLELAAGQPGFLGMESVRDEKGFGITVSYWQDEVSIAAWKTHAEHRLAQANGKECWYSHYEIRVTRVERAYSRIR
ncbi:MAG: antibiotic biosynthesis monooxygenase [Xanthomonadaceae bacterium]|jgi:heme-degrading monooxygenase HmoA|nr:antibiotic biosynthesis monooxygenase [Xanthomonadaceae bacterium]